MNKKLLFRADGNTKTGLGHVYRLLGLIEMFKETYDCIFITRTNTTSSVFTDKYSIQRIPEEITILDEPDWFVKNFPPINHIIICDGYHFVSEYQKRIKTKGYQLVYVDDLMSEYMYADVVINHSPEINAKDYQTERYTKLALGTQYALLRPEFLDQLNREKVMTQKQNVFVCFGGSDPHKFSHKVMMALLGVKEIEKIFIVVGAANKDENLIRLEKENSDKVKLFKNLEAKELLNIMLMSQLAVIPSSTILYELCCANTICLSGYYVDNQKRIHQGFLKNKAIYSMGNISQFEVDDFTLKIREVLSLEDHNEQIKHQQEMFDNSIKSRYLKLIKDLC